MRIVIQRVRSAEVERADQVIARIGCGLVLLVGFERGDGEHLLAPALERIRNLRVFRNGESHFELSLADTGGELLIVPQFTLPANIHRGRRPDFSGALPAVSARPLFEAFIETCHSASVPVQSGEFGTDMLVRLENDGPVTLIVDLP